MAKLEYVQEREEDKPESVERIEVRVWGPGGKKGQQFLIGSGANFHAPGTLLLEIIYTVNDVQFFYTRNYLQFEGGADDAANVEKQLEKFEQGEADAVGFGDMLPETSIVLRREKYTYQNQDKQEEINENYHLEISADVGAVVGHTSPGERMISIRFPYVEVPEGIQFMRELIHEVVEVHQGKHPNPVELPEGAGDWPFIRQLNQKAYDLISQDYQEDYFSNPLLTESFDAWLEQISSDGHVLDAGCGHGNPVIARLLQKGFRVTGTDLSPKMLERARTNFPSVTFVNQMVSDIRSEAEFDGVCSFSSLLYLDPIDLSHSFYRLYHAIKPGGLLFLYAYDTHPDWRGLPYDVEINQWMWSWSYGMEEAAQALEEFGYFKVLETKNVTTEEQKQERIENWRKYRQEEHDKLVKSWPPGVPLPPLDLSKVPQNLSYCYAIIARRESGSRQ